MTSDASILTPDDPALDALCEQLRQWAAAPEAEDRWPAEALRRCGELGVFRWFLPREWGGLDWSDQDLMRGYLRLSAASLTAAFVITQRSSACRWLVVGDSLAAKQRWLPGLASGQLFATVGISHLTTSRRHLARPVLAIEETPDGFVLDGFSPWVTGAGQADTIVTGGTLADGRQVLLAVPTNLPGIAVGEPARLVALSASQTGEVRFQRVHVDHAALLAGPAENVMSGRSGTGTGGLSTSALAVGLSSAAIEELQRAAASREPLEAPAAGLHREHQALEADLLALAAGNPVCSNEDVRARANSLVLRATQAMLTAAKGSGFVAGHPAGRWCREALFFLVWSCPQPVANATLCELAGLSDD
jgi:alkylation response protein AidB-like acyl-CoA dehydrogenase